MEVLTEVEMQFLMWVVLDQYITIVTIDSAFSFPNLVATLFGGACCGYSITEVRTGQRGRQPEGFGQRTAARGGSIDASGE